MPIDGYALKTKRLEINRSALVGWGGYFFMCSRAVKTSPTIPIITRTNCNNSDNVMYCIHITPISEGEIVTAYRVMTTPYG